MKIEFDKTFDRIAWSVGIIPMLLPSVRNAIPNHGWVTSLAITSIFSLGIAMGRMEMRKEAIEKINKMQKD